MPAKKHHVALTPEQRERAEVVARSHRRSARERTRARILLLADANREGGALPDAAVCEQVRACALTVGRVRRRFAEGGLEAALRHKEQANRKPRALDGAGEAFLIAAACSAPPDGQGRWTLRLLRDKILAAGCADAVSREAVRRALKKTNASRG